METTVVRGSFSLKGFKDRFGWAAPCKRKRRLYSGHDRLDLPVCFRTLGCNDYYIF